ncbi:MAG: Gfo/Idh/MocA family protein [Parvibaculaceae bacterium]|jgi:predicted dehydrogenase
MTKVKIVIAGGGLISQVEHVPNLLFLRDKFELVAVADPSPTIREHITRQFGVRAVESVDELWACEAAAIVIGAPDSYHHQIAAEALGRGLHVLCEKPVALSVAAIDDLIARRDAARRVLQVGFMKRWDPSYEMLAAEVADLGDRLRFVSVEVNDPDSWPFVEHQAFMGAGDLPENLKIENRQRLVEQTADAMGIMLAPDDIHAYVDSFSSSMIHDLNALNGLFTAMGIRSRQALSANIFAGGRGTSAVIALNGTQALCQLSHVVVPRLADYNERLSLFFDDRRYELIFPSPYMHNFPTRLISYTSQGMRLAKTEHRNGFGESFVRELEGFWAAIVNRAVVRNTPEEARYDMELVREFMALALAGRQEIRL